MASSSLPQVWRMKTKTKTERKDNILRGIVNIFVNHYSLPDAIVDLSFINGITVAQLI